MDEQKSGAPGATGGEPATTDTEPAPASGKPLSAPLSAFVRGGTGTSKSDAMFAALWKDAEDRRDTEAAAKKIGSVPIDEGGGMLVENPLATPGTEKIPKASLLLTYLTPAGEPTGVQCLADLVMELNGEVILILVCVGCMRRGRHMDQCQIQLRQQNKRFTFRAGMGAPFFDFEGRRYKSAGMIVETEKFRCGDCGWTARIDHNNVRPG